MTGIGQGPLARCGPAAMWLTGLDAAPDSDPPRPIHRDGWRAELSTIIVEGLAPSLVAAARSGRVSGLPLDVFLDAQEAAEFTAARRDNVLKASKAPLSRLRSAGITAAIIKGPCMARLYAEPDVRHYSDLDLLVHASDFGRALKILAELSYKVPFEQHRAWPWMIYSAAEGVNLHQAAGGNIDLHHHLPPWAFSARANISTILAGARHDPHLDALLVTNEHSALVAGLHVLSDLGKGKLALQSWRDLLTVAKHTGWDRIASTYEDHGAAFLFEVLAGEIHSWFPEGLPLLFRPPAAYRPHAARQRLRALGWDGTSWFSQQDVSWVARLPLMRALLFAAASAVPSRRYIRDFDGTYRKYWIRCAREARSTAGRYAVQRHVRAVDKPVGKVST